MFCYRLKGKRFKQVRRLGKLQKKARQKFSKVFDAFSLYKMMKQFKLLINLMLDRDQKFMFLFQRQNVLDSEASDDVSEDEHHNALAKFYGKNPFMKLRVIRRFNMIVQRLLAKEKPSEYDRRMIMGVVNKNIDTK